MTLPNKYKEAEAHLQTTPEMRQRLLDAADAMEVSPKKRRPLHFGQGARRAAALAACFVVAVAAFGIAQRLPAPGDTEPPAQTVTPEGVQEKLSFTLYAPSVLPEGYSLTDYTATDRAVTLTYACGDATLTYSMSESVSYPTGVGVPEADAAQIIPRDAAAAAFVTVGDCFVTLYGGDDAYLYADWYDAGKNFQLAFSAPLAKEDILAVIESIEPCA